MLRNNVNSATQHYVCSKIKSVKPITTGNKTNNDKDTTIYFINIVSMTSATANNIFLACITVVKHNQLPTNFRTTTFTIAFEFLRTIFKPISITIRIKQNTILHHSAMTSWNSLGKNQHPHRGISIGWIGIGIGI